MTNRTLARGLVAVLALASAGPLAVSAQDPPPTPPKDGGDTPPPADKPPADKPPADKPPADKPPADAPPPDEGKKAEEIKAFLKEYEEGLAKLTGEQAIAGIGKLKGYYLDPKVEADLKKQIVALFASKVVKYRGEGKDAYLEAACKALGDMGGDTPAKLLQFLVGYALEPKIHIKSILTAGLAGLGKIASPKPADVKFLTEYLKKDDEYIGDAARALAGYKKAPGAVRKDICEELLNMCAGVYSKSQANDNTAKRRWNIWGSEVIDAMKALSGKEFATPIEFRKWLNDKSETGGKNPKSWPDPPDAKDQKN